MGPPSLGDELILQARADAERTPAAVASPAQLEVLRAEAAQLFEALPEPPPYRKADDPARKRASELVPEATRLLGQMYASERALPDDTRLAALARAVEAHLRALAAIAAGEITEGDELAREAWGAARALASTGSFFRVEASPETAHAWDPETQASRYDPRPEPTLTVQLFCANQGCHEAAPYAMAPRYATHRFICSRCHKPFTGHFAEMRRLESRSTGRAVHYVLRVEHVGGGEATLEFDDASGHDLAIAPRDLVVLLYSGTGSLGAVENLTTGHVLWIVPKGACFLATAVYGEGAPELDEFRAFRDRTLLTSWAGRVFVSAYYRIGPSLAAIVNRRPRLKALTRIVLERIRRHLPGS